MSLPHQTTGDLITATIWNTQVDFINGVPAGTLTLTTTGNIAGLSLPSGNGPLVVFMNNATLATIQGITPGLDGQELTIYSVGAGQVDCAHQDAGATGVTYRMINFATSGKSSLAAGAGIAKFAYSATASRWRMVQHEQGDYIEYGATSTITGWSSRTTTSIRYKLDGRRLHVMFNLIGTSNSTTTTFTLPYATGAIGSQYIEGGTQVQDNGTTQAAPGFARMLPSLAAPSTVDLFKDAAGTAYAAANGKQSNGMLTVQVT